MDIIDNINLIRTCTYCILGTIIPCTFICISRIITKQVIEYSNEWRHIAYSNKYRHDLYVRELKNIISMHTKTLDKCETIINIYKQQVDQSKTIELLLSHYKKHYNDNSIKYNKVDDNETADDDLIKHNKTADNDLIKHNEIDNNEIDYNEIDDNEIDDNEIDDNEIDDNDDNEIDYNDFDDKMDNCIIYNDIDDYEWPKPYY